MAERCGAPDGAAITAMRVALASSTVSLAGALLLGAVALRRPDRATIDGLDATFLLAIAVFLVLFVRLLALAATRDATAEPDGEQVTTDSPPAHEDEGLAGELDLRTTFAARRRPSTEVRDAHPTPTRSATRAPIPSAKRGIGGHA